MASLQANAWDLGQRMEQCQSLALREKRQGQKHAALVHLSRMKQLQRARDERLTSLFTLETALDKVEAVSRYCLFFIAFSLYLLYLSSSFCSSCIPGTVTSFDFNVFFIFSAF